MTSFVLAVLAASEPHFLNADGESAARLAYDLDLPVVGSREQTVRAFLEQHADALGLQRQDELQLISRGDGDVVVFDRRRAGVSVLDAEVKATFDTHGRLMMVHLGTPLSPTQGAFMVDVARAEQVAGRGLDGVVVVSARAVWRRDSDALRPVFIVRLSREQPRDLFRAVVDGESGRLLYRFSERMSAGMGSVYDISPAKGPVVTRALGGLSSGATTLNGTRAIGRSCDGSGIGSSCTPKAAPNGSGDFVYTPSPLVNNTDRFAEVQGYYQADRYSAWLTTLNPNFSLPKLDVYVNVGNSNQGFYLGGGIELGQGPQADWAYEGDVIFHELGHGVVEHTSAFGFYGTDPYGTYGEGGSLNEGSADCLAFGFSGDPVLAEWIGPYLQSAGSLLTPYLRRVDDIVTCHGYNGNLDGGNPGRFGEIHDDGRIIGSFFWAVHSRSQSVAPEAASKAYLNALRSVNGSASYHDVAIAMQQNMSSLYGTQAGDLVTCLQCEREMPACDTRTRRIYAGETHESRLLGDELPAPSMGNGDRPSTFQYELAVPANTVVTIDRFAITGGALPKVYARFGQRVSWSGGNPTFDATVTQQGQTLPAQTTAGTWYLQGTLTDPGGGTRRYGLRAMFSGGTARPPAPNVSCSLGSGIGSCTCTPMCTGRVCGSNGCSGSCGTCPSGMSCNGAGQCACAPQCSGKTCGPDGCGGSCGTCTSGSCNMATGVCVGCVPQCAGKQCGPNTCGQSCGQCTGDNEICETGTGQCVDAGTLDLDGGTGGGSDSDGGDGGVRGNCGCDAASSGMLGLLTMMLLGRRRRGKVRT